MAKPLTPSRVTSSLRVQNCPTQTLLTDSNLCWCCLMNKTQAFLTSTWWIWDENSWEKKGYERRRRKLQSLTYASHYVYLKTNTTTKHFTKQGDTAEGRRHLGSEAEETPSDPGARASPHTPSRPRHLAVGTQEGSPGAPHAHPRPRGAEAPPPETVTGAAPTTHLLRDGSEEAGGVLGRHLTVQPQAAQVLVHGHLAEGLLPEILLPALLHLPRTARAEAARAEAGDGGSAGGAARRGAARGGGARGCC